jgi:hypothetical protein
MIVPPNRKLVVRSLPRKYTARCLLSFFSNTWLDAYRDTETKVSSTAACKVLLATGCGIGISRAIAISFPEQVFVPLSFLVGRR